MRRLVPRDRVLALWREGFSCRQIANIIGPVNGTKFTPAGVQGVIVQERKVRFVPRKYYQ